jgi:hypothetical protein
MGILIMSGKNLSIFKRLFCVALIVGTAISGSVLAQEPDPKELLARMSAEIAKLDSFVLSGDAYADASLGAGQIIEHSYDASMSVRKPSELRMTNRNSEFTGEIFFDNGVLTVFNSGRNFYAKRPIPDGFENAVNFALNDLGIKAPLLELITQNFSDLVAQEGTDVEYLGTSLFRNEVHDHIAVRGPEVDMQIWIATDGRPLPRKMALSSKWEVGAPRFVTFLEWDTSPRFSSDSFKFVPPDGATEIKFIPEL